MAESEVQICNVALSRIGVKNSIDDLDEEGTEAEACKTVYSHCRDVTLEAFPWPFAKKIATLAELVVTRTGWDHIYSLPTDCLVPRNIWTGTQVTAADSRIAFEVQANDALDGKLLCTDQEDASLVYTAKVVSVPMFSAQFADALAFQLAAELAMALPVSSKFELLNRQRFQLALLQAAASALRAGQEGPMPDSEFITTRG